jgi:non-ribosomal peptide synthetase component F
VIYGDANWYTGKILRIVQADQEIHLTIRLSGSNQLGEITTTGEAEVVLPRQLSRLDHKTNHSIDTSQIEWGRRDLCSTPVTVCDLFAKQVQTRPDAIAVASDEQTLTYRVLDTRAEHFARELQAKGLQTGNRLGLYLDRRPDTVVAILACAKAGIAYVP